MMKRLRAPGLLFRHPIMIGVLAGMIILLLLESFILIERDRRHQAEKAASQAHVATIRARLESELNATLSLSLGVSSFILSKPDFSPDQFAQVAAALIRQRPSIRSVAVAPNNVIRMIHPLAGNERAIGLRYMDTPRQRDAVLRLMREKRPVVAGPIPLVQGGTGIINRIPVLFTEADGDTRYWGLVSVAINPMPIFKQAGLLAEPGQLATMEYALRGRDGLGARGEVFLGSANLFSDASAVLTDVVIPGGEWQLAARPVSTGAAGAWAWLIHGLALSMAIAVGALLAAILSAHYRIRSMALEDSLTGLGNRHLFYLRGQDLFNLAKRSGRHLTLLNMDLDRFKEINDSHGHEVGDKVLTHAADCLRACLRETDVLARVGGDEFLALLPDTGTGPALDALLDRLRAAIEAPIPGLDPAIVARVSIGAAACSDATPDLEALVRLADHAMYRHKRAVA